MGAYKPSAISIFEDHAVIHLNTGSKATIDIEDVDLVKAFSWRVHPNGTGNIYASTKHLGRTQYLHRFLMKPPRHLQIDHIDGVGLNCRRANMRICTNGQNQMNTKGNSSSGFKGVFKNHGRETWRACITVNGVRYRSKSFRTAAEAARAYDKMANQLHGEFANPNLPDRVK